MSVPFRADPSPAASGPRPPVRCVQRRVDWLEIAYRIAVRSDVAADLGRCAIDAARDGDAYVTIGGIVGSMKRQRGAPQARYVITNGEASFVVDMTKAAAGWTVKIEWRAMTLARTDLRTLVRRGREIARSLGEVVDPEADGRGPELREESERVRRVDLAADFAGWKIHERDCNAFVGRALRAAGSGSISDYRPAAHGEQGDGVELDRRTFRAGAKVTGVTVCYGSPLCLRMYDKRAQLETQAPEKRATEESIWRAAAVPWQGPEGDDDGEAVTRVEAEIKGEVLRQFVIAGASAADERNTARNPDVLIAMLDTIWSYVTSAWVRLVMPGEASRLSRCPVDARWTVARDVRFAHVAMPMVRRRHRMGSDAAGSLGAVNSCVASRGKTYPIAIAPGMIASEHDTERAIRTLLDATAYEWAALLADEMTQAHAAADRHEHLIGVLRSLVAKRNGAFGRFYVPNDENVVVDGEGKAKRIGEPSLSLPSSFVPPWWTDAPIVAAAE